MEEKQFKFKFFLTAIFAAIVILLLWFFVSVPLLENAYKLKQDFHLSEELLAILTQKESRLAELKNLSQEVDKNFNLLAGTVLSEKNLLDFIVSVEKLAKSSKNVLTIDHLPPVLASGNEDFKTLSFRLNLWGSFPNFYRFLSSLENSNFWLNVDNVKIAKLNNFTLPVGEKFTGITANDVSGIVDVSLILGED